MMVDGQREEGRQDAEDRAVATPPPPSSQINNDDEQQDGAEEDVATPEPKRAEVGPISYTTHLQQLDGLVIVDVAFDKPVSSEFNLSFQNYYIHRMDVLAFSGEWKPIATDIVLMPHAHYADGSHDSVLITFHQDEKRFQFARSRQGKKFNLTIADASPPLPAAFNAQLTGAHAGWHGEAVEFVRMHICAPLAMTKVRFIMAQPSPVWKKFGIRSLQISNNSNACTGVRRDNPPLTRPVASQGSRLLQALAALHSRSVQPVRDGSDSSSPPQHNVVAHATTGEEGSTGESRDPGNDDGTAEEPADAAIAQRNIDALFTVLNAMRS